MGRPQPESQLHTTGVAITHPAETGFLKVSPASFGFACFVNLSHSLTSPSASVTASHPGGQKCHFREGERRLGEPSPICWLPGARLPLRLDTSPLPRPRFARTDTWQAT